MKRFFFAILSFLYLSIATGANFHFHYCMGEVANWSLWKNDDKECAKCGMEKSEAEEKGCCKDESRHVKLTLDQKLNTAFLHDFYSPVSELLIIHNDEFPAIQEHQISSSPLSRAPSRSSSLAVYIRHCHFRI